MYIVIAGGGKIGEYLANVLLQSGNCLLYTSRCV